MNCIYCIKRKIKFQFYCKKVKYALKKTFTTYKKTLIFIKKI